jgi:hypothetical protein
MWSNMGPSRTTGNLNASQGQRGGKQKTNADPFDSRLICFIAPKAAR